MKNVKLFKNIIVISFVASLIIGLSASAGNSATPQSITIGYTNFFTGKQADMAKTIDAAIQMALSDFNKTAKVPIKLITQDVGDTPITAKAGFEQILEKNPPLLLVFCSSANLGGVTPLLEQAKVPVVCANTLGSLYDHGWDWINGTVPVSSLEAPATLKYFNEKKGIKRIAVFFGNDDSGKSTLDTVNKWAKGAGVTIIPQLFTPNDNDFTANITAARRDNPDLYYINSPLYQDTSRLVKQIKQLGIKQTICANNHITNATFYNLLTNDEYDGLYGHSSVYFDLTNPKIADWAKRFKTATNIGADAFAMYVYDTGIVAFMAAEAGQGDKAKIKTAVRKIDYNGLAGHVKFDNLGRGRVDTNILQGGPNKTAKFIANVK